jgi:CRISPR-associated protein Cas5t
MKKLWLRLQAPFAAYRYFQAGVYRSTSPTIPHSAAWGLILNLAGIEVRTNIDNSITEIDPSAPKLLIAVGTVGYGERNTLYQQLHSYPVGNSGKEFAERTRGTKYWIAPVKREVLTDFDAMIGVQTDDSDLLKRIGEGLKGSLPIARYGLPFAGDNNLLFDQIAIVESPEPAYWYAPVRAEEAPRRGSCRLSVKIDRVDSSKSVSLLFAPEDCRTKEPPESAWIWTPTQP